MMVFENTQTSWETHSHSLNPCCCGWWSLSYESKLKTIHNYVLILVVVDDGLWDFQTASWAQEHLCLNPCCCGWWSLRSNRSLSLSQHSGRVLILVVVDDGLWAASFSTARITVCLNPCCCGWWSLSWWEPCKDRGLFPVLILVVVDDGLWAWDKRRVDMKTFVLILVVVDDGLWVCRKYLKMEGRLS